MTVKKLFAVLGVLILGVVVVVGVTGREPAAESAPPFDLTAAQQQLAGAPAPLAGLHAQSNEILTGGTDAFRARLAELEGHPVVVNKWASWCGPCRIEFPVFQQEATARGKAVAFIGLNGADSRGNAQEFLRENPIPFPSYEDPDEKIARAYKIPKNYPVTLFIDEAGKTAYIHQGQYRRPEDLAQDIDRYLGGA
jgi:thiol-disulfide isomerase/thioredoxin